MMIFAIRRYCRRLAIHAALTLTLAPYAHAQEARVSVKLDGLDGELRRNAETVMRIVSASKRGALPTDRIEQLYGRAPEEIQLALQPFGYYQPAIESQLDSTSSRWVAHFYVDKGPPLPVSRVDIRVTGEGESDEAIRQAISEFPLAVGGTLRHDLYEQGKLALATLVAERGFLDAAFDTAAIRIDRDRYTAEIVLHLNTGPRYFFGPVTINQDVVDPRLLEGYVTFQLGDTFDVSKLVELRQGLSSSPYFSQVQVVPKHHDVQDRRVPIDVSAEPRRRQRFEFGVGFGTDTKFRGSIEADFRRINRRGHNATVRLEASQIRRSVAGQYRFPPVYPSTASYSVLAFGGDISPNWSTTLRGAVGLNRSQLRGPFREVFSVTFDAQDFEIASRPGTSTLLILGGSYSWTKARDQLVPLSGIHLQLDALGSIDGLLSTASFLQLHAMGKFIRGLGSKTRLIGRGELSRTFTSQFTALPPTLRFVTGGDRTVRGYAFETLGPRDPEGNIVGGDLLVIVSSELDRGITEKWRVATFVDAGNGLAAEGQFFLAVGAGVGARWVSPVGLVRLDLAYGFDEPSKSLRIHFNFGPDL
jgi:translocation and assembly module TamA